MRTNKFLIMAGVVASLGLAGAVQAQISGSIGFGGTYIQVGGTSGNLATATSMSISNTTIISPSGAFLGANTPLFASSVGVNGNAPSLVGADLWSVHVGPTLYSFVVTTESQVFANATAVDLQGNGIAEDGIPAQNTPGSWTLQFSVSGSSFTYNSTTAVPEPTTLALAGLGGLSLMLFRRQRK